MMFDPTVEVASTALAVAILSFLVTCALVPATIVPGRYFGLLDVPDHRKTHARTVPLTGGIAVVGGLGAGCLAGYMAGTFPGFSTPSVPFFVAAVGAVLALGLFDDVRGCSTTTKLFVESIAAIMVVSAGGASGLASALFGAVAAWDGSLAGAAGAAVTVVWLVGVTNAVNFMDGLDGLLGGIAAIMAMTLAGLAALQGDTASMAVALALAGACVAYLLYNWHPAQVFLGDAGSLTIGFTLAWLALNVLPRSGDGAAVLGPLLVLGLPVFDALLVIRDRYREHPGRRWRLRMRRVFQADRRHLHHLLLSTVGGQRSVVLALCGFVVLFCGLALFATSRGDAHLGAGALAIQTVLLVLGRRVLARAPLACGRTARRRPRFAGANLFTVRRQTPQ